MSGCSAARSHEPASPPAGELRLSLLGRFDVSLGTYTVPAGAWRLRKAKQIVKLLALAPGHQLRREQVQEALWPAATAAAAANNLHFTLHAARRALHGPAKQPNDLLTLREGILRLSPNCPLWTDVEAFEAAARTAQQRDDAASYAAASELYAGELLPDDRYEDWSTERRERLRDRHLALLWRLAELHEAGGHGAAAIDLLRRVLAADPAHEAACAALMRLLALAGRRREALAQFRHLREVLRRECDAEPEPSLRHLRDQIVAGTLQAQLPRRAPPPTAPPSLAAERRRHNLPAALTGFIGRENEVASLLLLLGGGADAPRLVTLAGAGGCGKTRLALEVAALARERFEGGAWLIELASLTDAGQVEQALATALGVSGTAERSPLAAALRHLRDRRALVILDNCEHLVDSCAATAAAVLRACPRVVVLATSRQSLGVSGEVVWRVPPLAFPDPQQAASPEVVERYDAVRLFMARARMALQHDSHHTAQHSAARRLDAGTAAAIAKICSRLDGLPLAIELAASWVSRLSAQEIAARLEDPFRLLSNGSRVAHARHQALHALVDWSYTRLSAAEQTLFQRLTVFADGWTVEAAEAVCSGGGLSRSDVLETLARLADKSLVTIVTDANGAIRYGMLETLRLYGQQQRQRPSDEDAVRRRHARFYAGVAAATSAHFAGPEQAAWLARLRVEHGNVRAALAWAHRHGENAIGLRLCTMLAAYWTPLGFLNEGRQWVTLFLALQQTNEPSRKELHLRAGALSVAGSLARIQGDAVAARRAYQEGLALWRETGYGRGIASILHGLGLLAMAAGRPTVARTHLEESLAISRRLRDRWNTATVLHSLGSVALQEGDGESAAARYRESLALFGAVAGAPAMAVGPLTGLALLAVCRREYADAQAQLEECLALARETGYRRGVAVALAQLGALIYYRGRRERGVALLKESLTLAHELDVPGVIADCLEYLATAARERRQRARAALLSGAAEAMRERHHLAPPPGHNAYDGLFVQRQDDLTSDDRASWQAGRLAPLDRVIDEALIL